jgi:tRNA(Ile)-lysidine synthase
MPTAVDERPISVTEFDALMAPLAPFEAQPRLAVAVSGGADSMALALLADSWARARRGRVVALTVDHGLREGSRAEAREARARLAECGIESRLLVWRGRKPAAGIQAAARVARYGLMSRWCRRNGVLHLLLAHHREDQAETLLHRLGRGSGGDGLAGMAPIRELPEVRLLRPCLDVPRERLRRVLLERGVDWAEDPSNRNSAFARVRLRALTPALAAEGIDAASLSATAHRMAAIRATLEVSVARFLARHAALYPEGYAELGLTPLIAVSPEIGLRALESLLQCVGAAAYPPRRAALQRLLDGFRGNAAPRARTLAGCRIVPAGERIVIAREAGRCGTLSLKEGDSAVWDGRFRLRLKGTRGRTPRRLKVAALGEAGQSRLPEGVDPVRAGRLPAAARAALPAIRTRHAVAEVPHLGYRSKAITAGNLCTDVRFFPANPATDAVFPVV